MSDQTFYKRQPVSVLYGGAHLFREDTVPKMGLIASRQFLEVVPDCFSLASALGMPEAAEFPRTENGKISILRRFRRRGAAARHVHPSAWFAFVLYERLLAKLRTEAVEDYRIDFEDGYGIRTDQDEDRDADRCGLATADALIAGSLSPFFGIRIKPVSEEFRGRAFRTLEVYLRRLLKESGGRLPHGWVVTLPKVSSVREVEILGTKLEELERSHGLESGILRMELMVEDPRVLVADASGTKMVSMIRAGRGRVRSIHLGLYDFLSSLGIVSSMQSFTHPSADHLRSAASVIAAAETVWMSDGAVNRIPVAPLRGRKLTPAQTRKNHAAIRDAWKEVYGHVLHSLTFGYTQGWDLHPSQLVPRYAAIYSVFLRDYDRAVDRVKMFIGTSAHARVDGQQFDDIATGLGLLQFFARGHSCGALTREDLEKTGLSIEQIAGGSFTGILQG